VALTEGRSENPLSSWKTTHAFLSRSARRATLHLAKNWPWAEAFLNALKALRAVAPLLA
jgi:hypothetical protein